MPRRFFKKESTNRPRSPWTPGACTRGGFDDADRPSSRRPVPSPLLRVVVVVLVALARDETGEWWHQWRRRGSGRERRRGGGAVDLMKVRIGLSRGRPLGRPSSGVRGTVTGRRAD
ncbi:hypothetical protein ZWY2020_030888 [Hordeum vulgare]|nr:hypothetical protein ZWY2020_030888 [Hordeum vulgare]